MKICLLGETGSVHLECIATGLVRLGHRVHVICHKPVPMEGVTVERFAVPPFGIRYPARWRKRWLLYLRRMMRSYDIVHVHFLHDWGLTPEIADEGRLIVTPWGTEITAPLEDDEPSRELAAMRRGLLRMARCVTFFGTPFAHTIAQFADLDSPSFPLAKGGTGGVVVVPLGVNTELFSPRPARSDMAPRVGYFKGYAPVYDPETMISAAALVHKKRPDVRFDFVGSGVRRPARRRYAVKMGIDHAIRWIDRQPHDALPDIMAGWVLTAISSRSESYGLAALEASAMELPVIATDVGGLRETVQHDVTGLRVPPQDPAALADAMVTLINDPDRRREMGRRGRRMVLERFEENRCLHQLVDLYTQTIDSAQRRRAGGRRKNPTRRPVVRRPAMAGSTT
ncbi:MAG: glycosyltransferase family 4 protein [Planctomycetes bacterium]|nr:glycosyltransferase family 4 protein [Planctomycetota bacterium]